MPIRTPKVIRHGGSAHFVAVTLGETTGKGQGRFAQNRRSAGRFCRENRQRFRPAEPLVATKGEHARRVGKTLMFDSRRGLGLIVFAPLFGLPILINARQTPYLVHRP